VAVTVFDVVLKEIRERKDAVAQALVSGAARDHSEYRSLTGEFRGLSLAEGFINDLVRKMEDDE
jgi:hypothetical protein